MDHFRRNVQVSRFSKNFIDLCHVICIIILWSKCVSQKTNWKSLASSHTILLNWFSWCYALFWLISVLCYSACLVVNKWFGIFRGILKLFFFYLQPLQLFDWMMLGNQKKNSFIRFSIKIFAWINSWLMKTMDDMNWN